MDRNIDVKMGVEGTGSRSCPVAGFCVSDFELSGSTLRMLVSVVS
jgi:hypothetical protein